MGLAQNLGIFFSCIYEDTNLNMGPIEREKMSSREGEEKLFVHNLNLLKIFDVNKGTCLSLLPKDFVKELYDT